MAGADTNISSPRQHVPMNKLGQGLKSCGKMFEKTGSFRGIRERFAKDGAKKGLVNLMKVNPVSQEDFCGLVWKITDIPSMPTALQRYFDIIHDEVASLNDLEKVVRYDQSLSARILRIANSSYYGFRGRISSLSRAMVVIGFEETKRLCLCSVLLDLCRDRPALDRRTRERLWKHAFAVGKVAALIAEKRPWLESEEAYFLGLLHDLGKLILAVHLKDYFDSIIELSHGNKVGFHAAEAVHGISHGRVGRWVGVKWGFPEIYQEVMEFHHAPEMSSSHRPAVTLIFLANVLANSRSDPPLMETEETLARCGDLFISHEEWMEYGEKMARIWLEVDALWKALN